mgnify:CR=1 FL=1
MMPIFFSSAPVDTPAKSRSTRNAVNFSPSTFAKTAPVLGLWLGLLLVWVWEKMLGTRSELERELALASEAGDLRRELEGVKHVGPEALLLETLGETPAETGVEDPDGKSDGITLTDACVRRLRELAAEDPAASILRVVVDGGGCSGYQYTFSLDTEPAPRDRVFDVGGARVVVDEISFEFVKGATVDYVEEMIRSSFAIADNPNAESGCGCGSSFVAK